MNVCIWHELFDWRKTLTHFLTHSLAHSDTHEFMYADNSYNMTQTYDRKAKSEKRKAKSKKQNESRLWRNVCIWHELFDWRKTLTHFLTHSLAHSDTHVFMYADNSYNMTQTYDRKAKSEKRKAKSEKRKAKNKMNLDFDEMKVCIRHELFDWRKTLTHSFSNSLTRSLRHSRIHVRR